MRPVNVRQFCLQAGEAFGESFDGTLGHDGAFAVCGGYGQVVFGQESGFFEQVVCQVAELADGPHSVGVGRGAVVDDADVEFGLVRYGESMGSKD